MFSQQYRLRSEKDVMRTIRSKRFVIVVSTKVSKSSVERNRVRRQYREICKTLIPQLPSVDIALLVSKPALDLSFEDMKDQLLKTFVKAKLLTK
jgi:ribonuclease P protein component